MLNPDIFTFLILQEAAILYKQLPTSESLLGSHAAGTARAGKQLPPELAYLQYNAGDENTHAIILSAMVSAPASSSLGRAIARSPEMAKTLGSLRRIVGAMTTGQMLPVADAHWAEIAPWLALPGNIELLTEFLDTTGTDVWSGWGQHRGNVSRFRVLREYYSGL